jgi:hypothetical protein
MAAATPHERLVVALERFSPRATLATVAHARAAEYGVVEVLEPPGQVGQHLAELPNIRATQEQLGFRGADLASAHRCGHSAPHGHCRTTVASSGSNVKLAQPSVPSVTFNASAYVAIALCDLLTGSLPFGW